MKSFNLASLIQAKTSMSELDFNNYVGFIGLEFKSRELDCLEKLYENLFNITNLNCFYFGYVIPQIGKEFDLLRIGKKEVVNIELKSESTLEEVREQLIKNKYYLSFIEMSIHIYSYVLSTNELYTLNEKNELQKIEFSVLVELLKSQDLIEGIDLNEFFVPSNYLVSPFNSTEKFIRGEYFLNESQRGIKDIILNSFDKDETSLHAVKGEPGTGKTLLTYDIVKELMKDKKVAIIHCAELNPGQHLLNNKYDWDIFPINLINNVLVDDSYDVIVVDEAQRIYTEQLDRLYSYLIINKKKCIFSYDPKQCFSNTEFRRQNPKKIEEEYKARIHKLSKKIRTNKEITRFIDNLFNPRQGKLGKKYECIDIQYFSDGREVLKYSQAMKKSGWQIINFTPSRINWVSYDRYQDTGNPNAHKVIGQEYDKVLAIIDSNFFYSSEKYLTSRKVQGAPNYDLDKMLYQIVTRAKDRLLIVILNNNTVLKKCIDIISAE